MKKVFVILIAMCAVFAAQAQTKVAHINSSELLEMLPETDSIQAKLVQTQEMWQNLLLEKENQAKLKYAELMKVIDDPSVDDGLKEYKTPRSRKPTTTISRTTAKCTSGTF